MNESGEPGKETVLSEEMRAFRAERSRATAKLFKDYVAGQGLDIDEDTWTDEQRREFGELSDQLIAEWNTKLDALLAQQNAKGGK